MTAPDPHRLDLGAYVLDALTAPERTALEHHLASCSACQEELTLLLGLPALLRQVSAEEVLDHTAHDPAWAGTGELAERTLASLRRETSTRRHRTILLSSAAASVLIAALVGGSFATGLIGSDPGTTVTATDGATHIHASVRMVAKAGGTELELRLRGVPDKQRCMLVAVSRDGSRETAATWRASYRGEAELEGYTSFTPTSMESLEIVTPEGRALLRLPV